MPTITARHHASGVLRDHETRSFAEELPWRGYWYEIESAQFGLDRNLTPYAAAQQVVRVAGDVPDLWTPAGGDRLLSLLRDWEENPGGRSRINTQLREHIRSLRIEAVPPADGPAGRTGQ